MRRGLAVFTALFVLGAAHAHAATPLSHEGRWLTDAKGRVVVLHGWNVVSKVGTYRPEDTGFGADDARFLKRHGFNTVRLGVIYKALEPKPPGSGGEPRYADAYLRSIERTQRMLARHGIYTLLDFHQDLYNEKFQGEGWPDWQVLDDALGVPCPNQLQQGFPLNYFVNLGLGCAFDSFWANREVEGRGLQDHYAAAWRHVAKRFRGAPKLAGYNIINEPWPGTQFPTCISPAGCPLFDTQVLQPFTERVIAAIREADPETLAWYAPLVVFDFGADSSHGDTGDPRAGFAFNMYCLESGFLPATPVDDLTCDQLYELTLDNAERQAEQTGDALLMTEYGATDDAAAIEEIVSVADQHMMSWQQWHYCDCDDPTTTGTGVQSVVSDPRDPPRGENLNREKLAVTARPYPQVVAGTPQTWSFDRRSGEFSFSYSTESAAGGRLPRRFETKVFLPRLHYRHGFSVDVEGARARPAREGRILRVRRHSGADAVVVSVMPTQ